MDKRIAKAQKLKKAYKLATEFKKLRCWEYMEDTDMFGVMRPVDGLIAYICIMGNAGEVFGLNAYLGPKGLDGYLKILTGKTIKESIGMMSSHYCISLTYEEDQLYLDRRDKAVMKELGINYKTSDSIPFFRTYIPGYFPWYLTEDEVEFMELILEQSIQVCRRFKQDSSLLQTDKENHYLVRVAQKTNNHMEWTDKFLKAEPYREKWEPLQLNEIRLKKILKKGIQRKGIWEIGCDFFPLRINDRKSRPYMPLVFLSLDAETGDILGCEVSELRKKNLVLGEELPKLIEKLKTAPEALIVSSRDLKQILAPFSERLDIPVRFRRKPIYYQEAANYMIDFLNRGTES
ncbi:MAG: hypothetical protein PHN32_08325 [Actinomycetota bacterium]|jgi:hypothetical protein|nr:hypothetical protein [Actinomycetota bacterium]